MKDPGWKMKESDSSASKMINKNWVLKRKRRKLPYGPGLSNGKEDSSMAPESPKSTSSAKRRLKGEINSEQFLSKKKGNDGVGYLLCENHFLLFISFSCWMFFKMLHLLLIKHVFKRSFFGYKRYRPHAGSSTLSYTWCNLT